MSAFGIFRRGPRGTRSAFDPGHRRRLTSAYCAGLKPIIFVLNNDGYLIERLLCKNPESYYNDLAKRNYHKLPEALARQ